LGANRAIAANAYEAARLLEQLGIQMDTHSLVNDLGGRAQQMIEIAKALSQNARILVMDEPTAALSEHEIVRLFERIRRLKQDGIAIIYISHRLREVFESWRSNHGPAGCCVAATLVPSKTSVNELVSLMVGREVDATYRRHFCETTGEIALETRALTVRQWSS
jgi:ribose transport system ATP-binding protein